MEVRFGKANLYVSGSFHAHVTSKRRKRSGLVLKLACFSGSEVVALATFSDWESPFDSESPSVDFRVSIRNPINDQFGVRVVIQNRSNESPQALELALLSGSEVASRV